MGLLLVMLLNVEVLDGFSTMKMMMMGLVDYPLVLFQNYPMTPAFVQTVPKNAISWVSHTEDRDPTVAVASAAVDVFVVTVAAVAVAPSSSQDSAASLH